MPHPIASVPQNPYAKCSVSERFAKWRAKDQPLCSISKTKIEIPSRIFRFGNRVCDVYRLAIEIVRKPDSDFVRHISKDDRARLLKIFKFDQNRLESLLENDTIFAINQIWHEFDKRDELWDSPPKPTSKQLADARLNLFACSIDKSHRQKLKQYAQLVPSREFATYNDPPFADLLN